MKEYEIMFNSCKDKRITAYVIEPDQTNTAPGLIHIAHGWGGNRFSTIPRESQKEFAARYNLISIATEYRQSGYDSNNLTGFGSEIPYDFSHRQVIDCLNAIHMVLKLYPMIDKSRIIALGASQGGHISTLMPIFAPATFALIISCSGLSHPEARICEWAGRDFSEDELAIRNVVNMANRIDSPIVLIHGTADTIVPDVHSKLLAKALIKTKKPLRVKYVKGGGHTVSETEAFVLADDWLRNSRNDKVNVFDNPRRIVIPCVNRSCVIDWSKAMNDASLIGWEHYQGKNCIEKELELN